MRTQKLERWEPTWLVDFLFLNPSITKSETVSKCDSILRFAPASVCVKPCYVQEVVANLHTEAIQIGTIIGRPDGSNITQVKVAEAKRALTEGATLLSLPVNIGYVREKQHEGLFNDLHAVSGIAHMNVAKVEATFDPEWLEFHEILDAAQIAERADIDIIAVPINRLNGGWDLQLFKALQGKVGDSVQLKGIIENPNHSDLRNLFDSGIARLGIKNFKSIENNQ